MNRFKALTGHPREIEVRKNEVHSHARRMPGRIPVPLQNRGQTVHILRSFQRVEIVWVFSYWNSRGLKLLESFVIADADTSPVVALDEQQRAINPERLPVCCGHSPDLSYSTQPQAPEFPSGTSFFAKTL